MRGRNPKPAALKQAQGNPGRRPIVDAPADLAAADPNVDQAPAPKPRVSLKKLFKIKSDAQKVYDLIAPELKRINFLRSTDDPAFWRYCDTLARYWKVTKALADKGGETYECKTTTGETMHRLRPEFIVQERLARRLDTMEDRFGLTPMSRQQYMMALTRAPMRLFDEPPARNQTQEGQTAPAPAAPAKPPAIGALRGPLN